MPRRRPAGSPQTQRKLVCDAFLLQQGRGPISPITGKFPKRPHLESEWTRVLKEASFPGKPAFARI